MGFGFESLFYCYLPEVDEFFSGFYPNAWWGAGAGEGRGSAGFGREVCVDGVVIGEREVRMREGCSGGPGGWVVEGVVEFGGASEIMAKPSVICVSGGEFELCAEEVEVFVMVCECFVIRAVSVSVPSRFGRGVEVALSEEVRVLGFGCVAVFPYFCF